MTEEIADKLLRLTHLHLDRNAIVAGGWARDTYLGIKPKDLDIWFYSPYLYYTVQHHINTMLYCFGERVTYDVIPLLPADDATAGWAQYILKVKVHINGQWETIDFINFHEPLTADGRNVLDQFDFGLCAIGWAVPSRFIVTDAFERDLGTQSLTFNKEARDNEDLPRVVHDHLPRLLRKFPSYTPVGVPENVPELTEEQHRAFKVAYE